ncbi:MAG TPA: metallophosphoesterase family protein [Pyrinomonadaceae bacterium]|nr:metallophosphoesterase family protein [Pyrinomonadaceae bacterium]
MDCIVGCMRVFATSDLHTDYKENFLWLTQLSDVAYGDDTLIVAGDISDRLEIIRETLLLLRSKFRNVLFTPGNHELWVRNGELDSIQKLHQVLQLCDELGVITKPLHLDNLWIVPLLSWYDGVYDPEMKAWADFHLCKWPDDAKPLPDYFLRLNEPHLKAYDAPVITFSHFIPRADLLPPKEYMKFSWLPTISICAALEAQIRQLNAVVHVCGHTHTTFDTVIDDVRYLQNAVRYPKERHAGSVPIKLIWNTSD